MLKTDYELLITHFLNYAEKKKTETNYAWHRQNFLLKFFLKLISETKKISIKKLEKNCTKYT